MELSGKKLIEEIKNTCTFWNDNLLDSKKEQTGRKVELIKTYVELYLLVQLNRQEIKNIIFIDSMCNAGMYDDGDFCSSIEVLLLFIKKAQNDTIHEFHLVVNDKDLNRIKSTEWLFYKVKSLLGDSNNVKFHKFNKDVNEFLNCFDSEKNLGIQKYEKNSMILFVDPYNYNSVKFESIEFFLSRYYCELFYNFFSSDYTRNKSKYICNGEVFGFPSSLTPDELAEEMRKRLKTNTKIKYCFSYNFKTMKQVDLYQIIFATPNAKGLEKLKEAIIKVFKCNVEHVNSAQTDQLSLFPAEIELETNRINYAIEARNKILERFSGQTINYNDIEMYILENTVLSATDIIKYCLKPLIDGKRITKLNLRNRRNYKEDKFSFCKIE